MTPEPMVISESCPLVAASSAPTRHEMPARGPAGRAAVVYAPRTVGDVRAAVLDTRERRRPLVSQGANTGLVGSSVPTLDGACAVLSLDRMASIVDISPIDAVAVVQAGVRLSQLNEAAAAHGLHLPVDLAADPSIGGMIATNTGGSRVLRYGPMRRHVLGVEAVIADDDISVVGGLSALRKDSRGLDLGQMLVGSGGTLGVITRAVIALSPLPAATSTWWLGVDNADHVLDLFTLLDRRRPGHLSAFEYVSNLALGCALDAPGAPVSPFGSSRPTSGAVLVEWTFDGRTIGEGSVGTGSMDGLEHDVSAAFEANLIVDGVLVGPDAAWALRHRVSDSLRTFGTVAGHDISVPRRDLLAMRAAAIDAIAAVEPEALVCDFGHVGDGGLHLNVLFPTSVFGDEPPSSERLARLRAAVEQVASAHGGSFSAEHGLGPLNAASWRSSTPAPERRIVRALKSTVDPLTVLGHPDHPYNQLMREDEP
jgi:FAD/FMN-containing dehydrogenase